MTHRSRRSRNKTYDDSDPRIKSRIEDFSLLRKTDKWLKRQKLTPLFSAEQLADTCIDWHDASLDVDLDDPLDFEMRYFLPGPVEAMERAIEEYQAQWLKFVSRLTPIKYHLALPSASHYSNMMHDVRAANSASNMGQH